MLFTVFYSSPRCYQIISRLRFGFSHLRKDKFTHNFHDTLNHLYSCSLEPETNLHYLLCCHNFSSTTLALMSDLNLINPTISRLNKTALANILLYGESKKRLSTEIRYLTFCQEFRKFLLLNEPALHCFLFITPLVSNY